MISRNFNPLQILSENIDQNDEFRDGEVDVINDKNDFESLVKYNKTIYFEILEKETNETQILSIPDVPMLKLYKQHMY